MTASFTQSGKHSLMARMIFPIVKAALFIAYPFIVFFALGHGFSPRLLSILILLMALLQFQSQQVRTVRNAVLGGMILVVSGLWLYDDEIFLRVYPVLISVTLLAVFGLSLRFPPTVIERFAAIRHKELPEQAVSYCRYVTAVWCAFFAVNAIIAGYTVGLARDVWTLYNGFISYMIIGVIMGAEFCFRKVYMKRIKNGSGDIE